MGLLGNKLFCKHNYITVTNLYGDAINYYSASSNKIIRSIQRCKKCGKIHKSEYLDKDCKIINYTLYYNNGIFREVNNEDSRTLDRGGEI